MRYVWRPHCQALRNSLRTTGANAEGGDRDLKHRMEHVQRKVRTPPDPLPAQAPPPSMPPAWTPL
eukprot:387275-Prorocentrum_minimum.AAC.2